MYVAREGGKQLFITVLVVWEKSFQFSVCVCAEARTEWAYALLTFCYYKRVYFLFSPIPLEQNKNKHLIIVQIKMIGSLLIRLTFLDTVEYI